MLLRDFEQLDTWARRHGLFEFANCLANDGGNCWARGTLQLLAEEYSQKWPCDRCDRQKPECVCHPRGEG